MAAYMYGFEITLQFYIYTGIMYNMDSNQTWCFTEKSSKL